MQLLQSELAPESILPAPLYDMAFKGARVQRETRLQVVILALLVVSLVAPGHFSSARASAWELDPAATRIAFSVKNLSVAYVDGTFRLASGRVVLDDGDLSRSTIEAVIDAGSGDTDQAERGAHLRSADFLDVTRYPTIPFRCPRIDHDDVHQHRDRSHEGAPPMTIWRRGGVLSVTCALSLWTAMAHGACTNPSSAAAVRAMADAQCPCATATSHREYVKCVAGVAKSAVASGSLPKQCKRAVLKCAAQSTCGRPGFVSGCRTSAKGVTKCSIKAHATKCRGPKGGAACVQDVPSCCDACSAGSCPLSATTTIPGAPTTTTMIAPQTHTVMVGQDGLTFTPARLTIHVGDTGRWICATPGHSGAQTGPQ